MTRAAIAGGALITALVLLGLVLGLGLVVQYPALERAVEPTAATPPAITPSTPAVAEPAAEVHPGFLYGRITAVGGVTFEGGCAGGAIRRRSGATTSTAPRTRTPGPSTRRSRSGPR